MDAYNYTKLKQKLVLLFLVQNNSVCFIIESNQQFSIVSQFNVAIVKAFFFLCMFRLKMQVVAEWH